MNAKILDTPIPNQSGSFGIPVIGKIVWSVTNIKFKTLQFSNAQLTTVPGVGLKLYIQNINVDIAMDFQVQLKVRCYSCTNERTSESCCAVHKLTRNRVVVDCIVWIACVVVDCIVVCGVEHHLWLQREGLGVGQDHRWRRGL